MKRFFKAFAVLVAIASAAGCAKEIETTSGENEKRYFDAWLSVQMENSVMDSWVASCMEDDSYSCLWQEAGNGLYILAEENGTGDPVKDSSYIFVSYVTYDLDRNVLETNREEVSHKTGTNYDVANYYGPKVWINSDASLTAGVKDIVSGMNIGDRKIFIVPAWMNTSDRYSSEEEYIANISSTNYRIYDIEITDASNDINRYQTDLMQGYWEQEVSKTGPENQKEYWDTTYTGFLFRQYFDKLDKDENGSPAMLFDDDSTIYINYTGRLLNGQVFDTTIADTAKVHKIYNQSKTYSPVAVKWSADSTSITLGGSSDIIDGFKSLLKHLHNEEPGENEAFTDGESAVAVFYSGLGYGYYGSGSTIPAYAPLRFDITVVKEEE